MMVRILSLVTCCGQDTDSDPSAVARSFFPRSNPIFALSFLGHPRDSHPSVSTFNPSNPSTQSAETADVREEEEEEEILGERSATSIVSSPFVHRAGSRAPADFKPIQPQLCANEAEREDLVGVPVDLESDENSGPILETRVSSSTTSSYSYNPNNLRSAFSDWGSSIVPDEDSTMSISLQPSLQTSSIVLPYQLYVPPPKSSLPLESAPTRTSSSLSNLDISSFVPPLKTLDGFESPKSTLDSNLLLPYSTQRRSSIPAYIHPLVRNGHRNYSLNLEDGELIERLGRSESLISA